VIRLALTRRWLVALAVCLVMAAGCVRAGFWQWSRYELRTAINARIEANIGAPPVAVDRLTAVGAHLPQALEWRPVTVTGRYDEAHQMLVRNRPLDGANGFHVLVPLVSPSGSAFLVDRGWVASAASATASPDVPPPPTGQVTVVARLRPAEPGPAGTPDLPAGQVRRIAVGELAAGLPYPVYGAYGELVTERPPATRQPAALPEQTENAALNLGYTVQWFMFALIALVGWVVLVRREAADNAAAAARSTPESAPRPPPEPLPAPARASDHADDRQVAR